MNSFNPIVPALFVLFGFGYLADEPTPKPRGEMRIELTKLEPLPVEDLQYHLTDALIQVESAGKDSAFNISENAAGCLQIRPIMVREVNRILRKQGNTLRFDLSDRWSRDKSLEMFHIWREYHHPNSTDEVIARNWNGGPKGYEKESTIKYWKKVKGKL